MLDIHIQSQADRHILKLRGRFDFSGHRGFRDAYTPLLAAKCHVLDIDLEGVDYLDSSALGMLLLLQERAQAVGIAVRLLRAKGIVKDILDVAHFERFFEIEA